jgi:hypothetical protein
MQVLNKMLKNSKFLSDFFPGPLLGVRKSGTYPLGCQYLVGGIFWRNFFPHEKFPCVCDGGLKYLRRAGGIFNYFYFK